MNTLHRKAAAVSLLLVGAMALSGCQYIADYMNQNKAQRDEETAEITEEGELDIFSLEVGDCVADSAVNGEETVELTEVAAVPCAKKHDLEVIHEFSLPDGDLPSEDEITTAAAEECLPVFDEFIGVAFEESTIELSYFSPSQESWDQADDRLVQCYVYDPAGQVMGTLEGAAR